MRAVRILQYLGLRRAPGTQGTTTERVATTAMVVVVAMTIVVTRDLDSWTQWGVLLGVSILAGLLGATATTVARRRRTRLEMR